MDQSIARPRAAAALAALALVTLASGRAWAKPDAKADAPVAGHVAALLPVVNQGIGAGTAAAVASTVVDALAKAAISIIDPKIVSMSAATTCSDPACEVPEDMATLGAALGADLVIRISLADSAAGTIDGEDAVDIVIVALDVSSGEAGEASETVGLPSLLAAGSRLLASALPEKFRPAPDPCAGEDCSGHGDCVFEIGSEEDARCECEPGWFAAGAGDLDCVALGADLFGAGANEKKPAALPHVPAAFSGPIRAQAGAGIAFAIPATIVTTAAYAILCTWLDASSSVRAHASGKGPAWTGLWSVALSTHAIGVPLLISSHMRARAAAGLEPLTGPALAGWIVWAASIATMAIAFYRPLTFAATTVSLPLIAISSIIAMHEGAVAAHMASAPPDYAP